MQRYARIYAKTFRIPVFTKVYKGNNVLNDILQNRMAQVNKINLSKCLESNFDVIFMKTMIMIDVVLIVLSNTKIYLYKWINDSFCLHPIRKIRYEGIPTKIII